MQNCIMIVKKQYQDDQKFYKLPVLQPTYIVIDTYKLQQIIQDAKNIMQAAIDINISELSSSLSTKKLGSKKYPNLEQQQFSICLEQQFNISIILPRIIVQYMYNIIKIVYSNSLQSNLQYIFNVFCDLQGGKVIQYKTNARIISSYMYQNILINSIYTIINLQKFVIQICIYIFFHISAHPLVSIVT
eukprot:TRINITY_DN5986_c0_g2_i1.p5 TRINITY_DN5986_c0_g2~~TRINITY_DN5986_c0_g2_i1.p5  ORF type:complete len:188 (+),score=-14.13 TRINITY_DN5986_c0_g2_i1:1336-1899(+)